MKKLLYISAICAIGACSQSEKHPESDTDNTRVIVQETTDILDTTGGKGVFFVDLKDSQEVKSPFKVKMGVKGMELEPAGAINQLKGHHHIIIDEGAIPEGQAVPLNETNLHFGKGQTETELKLAPGYHTITLQFGNGVHASYGPRWSRTITVMVK